MLSNRPWWILIGAALCFNLFTTVRGATVAYFFADVIGADAHLDFGTMGNVLFYSGLFLGIGEIANMAGVALTVPIASRLGKKRTFIAVNVTLFFLSIVFFIIAKMTKRASGNARTITRVYVSKSSSVSPTILRTEAGRMP